MPLDGTLFSTPLDGCKALKPSCHVANKRKGGLERIDRPLVLDRRDLRESLDTLDAGGVIIRSQDVEDDAI